MATIGGDVTEKITSEVDLFGSMMQQNEFKKNSTANMLLWQQSNQVWPLNLRLKVRMTCTWI